jgi:hypothetical protein
LLWLFCCAAGWLTLMNKADTARHQPRDKIRILTRRGLQATCPGSGSCQAAPMLWLLPTADLPAAATWTDPGSYNVQLQLSNTQQSGTSMR